MKLEYLHDLTDDGKYKQVVSENLIRLYDFNKTESLKLIDLINRYLVNDDKPLDLSEVDFVQAVNCRLILHLSDTDDGVLKTTEGHVFNCGLTREAYQHAIETVNMVDDGFNWLCDTSEDNIDFLYSPGGTW